MVGVNLLMVAVFRVRDASDYLVVWVTGLREARREKVREGR